MSFLPGTAETIHGLDSPPVWTQEAYRLPRRKYSICCPILEGGGGYPIPGWGEGYPIPGQGGYPIPGWREYPIPGSGGYPIPGSGGTPYLTGGTLSWDWGTPWEGTWDQWLWYPLGRDLWPVTGVPPWKGHGTSGSIMGWRWGNPLPAPPPPTQLWTDRHLWKQFLPVVLPTRPVNM